MGLIIEDFYQTLTQGAEANILPISIDAARTAALEPLIQDIEYASQAVACLCALLLRYPEPELIKLSIQRLLATRPQSMGTEYRQWKREVYDLSLALRGHAWEEYFRQQIRRTYPKVALNLWGQQSLRAAS